MKSVEKSVEAYEDGVRNFGVETYGRCADAGGWHDVAECLHNAKKSKMSLDLMVKRYRDTA